MCDDRGMTSLQYRTVDSPVGPITFAGTGTTLFHLRMTGQAHEPDRSGWAPAEPGAFTDAVEQLAAYFAGELTAFDLDLELVGTDFQRRVWSALQTIPTGRPAHTARSPSKSAPRRFPGRRTGQRTQPDRHHRPVPPGYRRRRRPDRLRRRPRSQTDAPIPGGTQRAGPGRYLGARAGNTGRVGLAAGWRSSSPPSSPPSDRKTARNAISPQTRRARTRPRPTHLAPGS